MEKNLIHLDPLDTNEHEPTIQEVNLDESSSSEERKKFFALKRSKFTLHKYEDLPEYMKDNHYITDGYRVHFTYKLCVQSLFRWHNETLNIWTHLIAAILFFVLMIFTFTIFLENPNGYDMLVFIIFLIVAQIQMIASAIFHTFGCSSPHSFTWLAKLDYSGITFMIVGSYYPPLYYGFRCFDTVRIVYLTGISILGVIGLIVSFLPIFATPRFRVFRAVFFLIFGFSAVFPFPHMVYLNGFDFVWPILWKEFLMGGAYTIGAVIYSTRVPERFYPGKLNCSWSSHPIWHLFVVAGGLFQFWTCIFCFYHRRAFPCSNIVQ